MNRASRGASFIYEFINHKISTLTGETIEKKNGEKREGAKRGGGEWGVGGGRERWRCEERNNDWFGGVSRA